VTTALGGPAVLWRNLTTPIRHWLQVALTGTRIPRDGIGARVRVGTQVAWITTSSSYASSKPPVAHFGLDGATTPPEMEVTWPDGTMQKVTAEGIDRVVTIVQEAVPGTVKDVKENR
jgi:hypothetical protein